MRLMRSSFGKLTFPLMFAIAVCGCRARLSPESAQTQINQSAAFSPASIDLSITGPSVDAGVKQQCWTERYDGAISLTDKGYQIFSSCVGRIRGSRIVFFATTAKPIRRHVVQVFSITDSTDAAHPDAEKIVDFTWQWELDGLPKEVKDCMGLKTTPFVGGQGEVVMKLDKDAWRVEKYEDRFGPG